MFTSSSTKQISIEPDPSSSSSLSILNWLRSDSKVHSYEPVLCVPPILSSSIALLLQTWSIQDLYSLTYDRSIVLDLIEYYKTHNSFPHDISGCQVLSINSFFLSLILDIILYIIESFSQPLLPLQHYEVILNSMLLFDTDMKIQMVNTLLTDLPNISKVLLDQVITPFSQLIATCFVFLFFFNS